MFETTLDTIPKSSLYKMDNVLYEIHDNKGISVNNEHDPWKQEALVNLISTKFIFETEGNYFLTEEGHEVIRCDSLTYYRKKRGSEEFAEKIPERKSFLSKLFMDFGIFCCW
ncbi:hypothetical protein [Gillisia limnaea]|uniref:Uncharacterized protein n=1 Tax=Gillisia limnaea (strain DSM 15749 / LMG 21470 / R-8282) TaxID=865937 RepID=H2BYD6_GILLR|nr:hypothetical protein [Gillisia limnaea]EHQ03275.1 hypothetical protein Gilli_2659 [Gillisia limnaea DSM 15749]